MSVTTLIATPAIIEKMEKFYADYFVKTPAHARFQAKIPGCTITAYHSNKVVFQGGSASKEAETWQAFTQPKSPTPVKKVKKAPIHFDQFDCIGCDESGVGDYFGPVTAACIYIPKHDIPSLQTLGITDSKKMTDDRICEIAPQLMKQFPYAITILPNPKYNQLQAQGINGHMMKALLHNQALTKLFQEHDLHYDYIIMDQFVNEQAYYRYFSRLQVEPIRGLTFLEKAESQSVAVAAASVLARYTYVKAMEKLASTLGRPLPKGASKAVDRFAAQLITEQGLDCLDTYAKQHFVTTQKAIDLAKS